MFDDETERLIFRFTVRGKTHHADPLAVRRNLLRASQGEFDQIDRDSRDRPEVADGMGGFVDQGPEHPAAVLQREDAREKLHAITCAAFGLTPFSAKTGEGVTEAETLVVLDSFQVWLEGNASGAETSPPSPAPTGSPEASPSTTPPTAG